MRLTTLRVGEGLRVGLLDGEVIRLLDPGVSLVGLLGSGQEGLAEAVGGTRSAEAVPVEEAVFGPLLDPPAVRDFATFEQHGIDMAGQVPAGWYDQPLFYFSNPAAVTGPYDDVPVPPLAGQYDYELEIGAVIGWAGSDLTPEQAAGHIAGYTIVNDWSARDLQRAELASVIGPAKSKDAAITLGPWLVTADELADFTEDGQLALSARVRYNGRHMGGGTTADMAWTFPELAAYAARGTTIRPGDVLASGTFGSGCLFAHNRVRPGTGPGWLKPGDVVRIDAEQLGFTENRVVPGPAPVMIPRGRNRILPPQPVSG